MNRHLVSVEVSVESGAGKRMQLDGLALDQHRLERLDAKSVQRRSTVQHNRMLLDHAFQHIPDLRSHLLDHALRILDIMGVTLLNQFLHDERFEQLQRHLLRQTALIEFQLRSDDDYGTAGIVDTLAQQVLTESALLTLQHVGQGFQSPSSGSRDRSSSSAVIDQRVYRLLQHSLLVSYNDVRSAQLKQAVQTVVPVDDSTVQIVQVGGGETAAVQLHHRAQIGRNNRNYLQNHPFRTIPGKTQGLHNLQTADDADLLLSGRILQLLTEFRGELVQIDALQKFADRFGAHRRAESVSVLILKFSVLLFGEDLFLDKSGFLLVSCVQYDVGGKIQNPLQVPGRNVQNQSHPGRNSLEVPDVRDRSRQLDVPHSLSSDLGLCDLNAAAVADDSFVADALVFTTVALPVLHRSEDPLAEESVCFRLQGSVIDRLRLLDFAVGPLQDLFCRSKLNLQRFKIVQFKIPAVIFVLRHRLTPLSYISSSPAGISGAAFSLSEEASVNPLPNSLSSLSSSDFIFIIPSMESFPS